MFVNATSEPHEPDDKFKQNFLIPYQPKIIIYFSVKKLPGKNGGRPVVVGLYGGLNKEFQYFISNR